MGKNEVPVRVDCLSHYCLALDFDFFFFFFLLLLNVPSGWIHWLTLPCWLDSPGATHTQGMGGLLLGEREGWCSLYALSTHLEAIQTQLFLQWKDKKKEEEGGDGERPSGNEWLWTVERIYPVCNPVDPSPDLSINGHNENRWWWRGNYSSQLFFLFLLL